MSCISSAKLNSTSHYSFTVKPGTLTRYVLRVYDPATANGLPANYSPQVSLTTVPPTVHIAINHTVIHLGTSAVVSGYVSANAHGHVVYLQNLTATGWKSTAHYQLNAASRYTFTIKPGVHTTYTLRIWDPATSTGVPQAFSQNVRLTVQTRGNVTLVTYSGSADYQGPRITIPTLDYAIAYTYYCPDPDLDLLDISWNGDPFAYEDIYIDPATAGATGTATWYGHEGARSGYFDVLDAGCSWSFRVVYTGWQ